MFTGLVESLGRVLRVDRTSDGVRLLVATELTSELGSGDSVAVNGVCLTVAALQGGAFAADVMNETLARTSLAAVEPGTEVNIELPLRPSDRLGGHIVQGHVDGLGEVVALTDDGFSRRVEIQAPAEVLRYVVEKGSIAVDGVSLTVAGCSDRSFTVALIPETLQRTNLGRVQPGARVNIEVDVVAKYVERLVRT
jgi:riboflavin synthase